MKIIKEFSTNDLKEIRASLNRSLAQTASEFNIDIQVGNINYMEKTFTAKLDVSLVIEGEVFNKEATAFKSRAKDWGCLFDLYWTFIDGKDNCKVIGLNTRSSKYPVIVKNITKNKTSRYRIEYLNQKYKQG